MGSGAHGRGGVGLGGFLFWELSCCVSAIGVRCLVGVRFPEGVGAPHSCLRTLPLPTTKPSVQSVRLMFSSHPPRYVPS